MDQPSPAPEHAHDTSRRSGTPSRLASQRARRVLAVLVGLGLASVAALVLVPDRATTVQWVKGHLKHPFDRADTLDEERAALLFDLPRIGHAFRYDPIAYLQNQPNFDVTRKFPEHPDGRFRVRTNSLCFHEDEETVVPKAGVRVLVSGDSHTAGLVNNNESYANRCEALLRAELATEAVDVINAGSAYTGPSCYRGVLEKSLGLDIDVFVATLFTGNDFADELRLRYMLDGWSWPLGSDDYRRRAERGSECCRVAMSQGLNQAARWQDQPAEAERSLELAIEAFRSIHSRCTEAGIDFIAVVLPTKMDVDEPIEMTETLCDVLGLTKEAAGINAELGSRFAAALRDHGIQVLDPLDSMRASDTPLYWSTDYHLNVAGHDFLARRLTPLLADLLAPAVSDQ